MPVVGIVSPGEMGSALGARLLDGGQRVVVALDGRSDRTRGFAHHAGLEDVGSLAALVEAADVVLSVVPPGEAAAVARAIAATRGSTRPLVADLNAVSPKGARELEATLRAAGLDLVDGSISGPAPSRPGTTRVYLSGGRAAEIAALRLEGVDRVVVGAGVGLASAVKMSTASVYLPNEDPLHSFLETDPLGDARSPHAPTYSISKIAEEAVARTCARLFDLPVVIARMNASYGPNGGLPAYHLDWIVGGQPVVVRWDPCPYSVIHQDDINVQAEALLAAASVPATVVNWGGDEAVSPQEWCAYFGELTGRTPEDVVKDMPGTHRGSILDPAARRAITGPCTVGWRDGMRRLVAERYPDGVDAVAGVSGQASNLLSAYTQDG